MTNPKGTYVPPVKTPVSPTEAVQGFRAACERLWQTTKPETIAVLTAQSALESGRWSAMWNYNPSNIKHENSREGLFTAIRLNEVLNGKVVWFNPDDEWRDSSGRARRDVPPGHPQCRMRAFETFADGVADKLAFLNRDRYKLAKAAALAGDPSLYVRTCRAAGYFTAALEPYERAVLSLFRTFLPIAQAAAPPAQLPPEEDRQLCADMAECMRIQVPEWLRNRVAAQVATGMTLGDDYWKGLR
jgi:hypothetical protein